jgi:pyruvate dehydrogenase E2 component (dihydrolipoyllysine-residue acetyltransferase)
MVAIVRMPKLTQTMEEALIGNWTKREGETVEKDEIICEVETEKTTDEIAAPEAGVLRKILIPAGSSAKLNQIIAVIAKPDEPLPDLGQLSEDEEAPVSSSEETPSQRIESLKAKRVKISPAARRLAKMYGIDYDQIKTKSQNERITKEDVMKIVESVKDRSTVSSTVEESKIMPLGKMRQVIANRLSLSMKTTLHVPLTIEADMTEVVKFVESSRAAEKANDVHITYTDILVKAAAKALENHPIMNSTLENGNIKILENINIGVAVAIDDGLLVPVVHNANKKSIAEISKTLQTVVSEAKEKKSLSKENLGGTFTISNLGMFGVDIFAPIINPPESAILGVGRIAKKPIIINNGITIRSMITLTLVFDHRIMDGAVAARFLQTMKQLLENLQPIL